MGEHFGKKKKKIVTLIKAIVSISQSVHGYLIILLGVIYLYGARY